MALPVLWNATFALETPSVGFGTAGLGPACFQVVQTALEAGFRVLDTAEADYWYDQAAVGRGLEEYWRKDLVSEVDSCVDSQIDECVSDGAGLLLLCAPEGLRVSTKIPPWSLTSVQDIRNHAAASRRELVGFCQDSVVVEWNGHEEVLENHFPLDVYFIHAPACWDGWHPRCDNPPDNLLDLRSAWMALEAVVGLDYSARRIGLSNVSPAELLDIIHFVRERQESGSTTMPPPRMPDAVQAFADPIYPSPDLRRICQQHGIEFVSYSTLGTQHRATPNNPVLTHTIVRDLSDKYQRSTAEVVLSWALQNSMSIIPRSSREPHIVELATLINEPHGFLSQQDLLKMDSIQYTGGEMQ
jgi:diketogulonate reductase-like aldo/keto reductase